MVFSESSSLPYRVLARTYRPQSFQELIGQETLVESFKQAIEQKRLPHAFIFTGIRGVGKTTSARILARCLNCARGPTFTPCGDCASCKAIQEDRHLDVIEIDAASRTGVDDIREVIEAGRYRAVMGTYKVFIIDEVHMLSKSAFNALLKTLEEPPPHLIFIFATTEIDKIPATILSRCMRCELKRIEQRTLSQHFKEVATKEGAYLEQAAAELLARAAEGSARDGMSLLDQAITLSNNHVTMHIVEQMLGLIDKARIIDFFTLVARGDIVASLTYLRSLYHQGANCLKLCEDLLEIIHTLALIKVKSPIEEAPSYIRSERERLQELAEVIPLAALMRSWHLLLKGCQEIRESPNALFAFEMMLVRLTHQRDFAASPALSPDEQITVLTEAEVSSPQNLSSIKREETEENSEGTFSPRTASQPLSPPSSCLDLRESENFSSSEEPSVLLNSFQDVLALLRQKREMILAEILRRDTRLVSFAPGEIVLQFLPGVVKDFPQRLGSMLEAATHKPWRILQSEATGEPTLLEQEQAAEAQEKQKILSHPLVKAAIDAFPEAVVSIKTHSY